MKKINKEFLTTLILFILVFMFLFHDVEVFSAPSSLTVKDLTATGTVSGVTISGVTVFGATVSGTVYLNLPIREKLTADRIYYVRVDGNDSNTGLINSAAGAWLTIQHAVDYCRDNIDAAYSGVTIQLGPGTYTEDVKLHDIVGADPNHQGNKKILILGNYADPSGVTIQGTANCITAVNVYHPWYIDGVVLISAGSCVLADYGGAIYIGKVIFNTAAIYHVNVMYGSKVEFCDDYTINGSAVIHLVNQWGGIVVFWNSRTVTLTGTPAFTIFTYARGNSITMARNITFSGAATGQRFNVTWGGLIDTNGAIATYFPGSTSGTTGCCSYAYGYYY